MQKSAIKDVFSIDLRSLATFRIVLGSLLLIELGVRARFLRILFTDDGLLPAEAITSIYGRSIQWTSLHFHTAHSVWLQGMMFAIAGVFAIAFIVGYQTRWVTLICWALFISLNRRIPASCYGFDDVMRLMLFWSFFLPIGARWSIDSWRSGVAPDQNRFCSMGTVAILLQVCSVYWFTAIWKAHPDWLEGRALQFALEAEATTRPLGMWFADKRWLTVPATYLTLIVEFFIPFVALSPWKNTLCRWIAIASMWGLHLGIFILLNIGLFPHISIAYWIVFLPTSFWDYLAQRRQGLTEKPQSLEFHSSHPLESGRVVQVLLGLIVVQITAYNILGLPQLKQRGIEIPRVFGKVTEIMRVDQTWRLYAPSPRGIDGWVVMPAELVDGSTYDVWTRRGISYEKQERLDKTFRFYRIKMLYKSALANISPIWPSVARCIAREWNEMHGPEKQIKRLQIVYVYEKTHNGGLLTHPLAEYDAQQDKDLPISPGPIQPSSKTATQ